MTVANDIALRIDALRDSREFRIYERVREEVFRLRALDRDFRTATEPPSDYWAEELSNFDYLFDASPLIVSKLRHHSYHVTGLKAYEYRSHRDAHKRQLAQKLEALVDVAGGRDLLVPEPRLLGGFGHEIDGALYNLDTLKFFEVLIALDKGAVLDDFRTGKRRTVWEIGAGWGGFAYAFKTLFPNTTYVITDFPELFLFSATYLQGLFPEAKVHFFSPEDPMGPEDADFVFAPNTFLVETRPPRLDLSINMVSYQEMTADQVDAYVKHAFDLGAPYLYSLNRDRSPYNDQITSVREIIGRYFWPQQVEVLPGVQYTQMLPRPEAGSARARKLALKAAGRAKKVSKKPDLGYKHVIGWRRRPA
jgi:hypothetical protein